MKVPFQKKKKKQQSPKRAEVPAFEKSVIHAAAGKKEEYKPEFVRKTLRTGQVYWINKDCKICEAKRQEAQKGFWCKHCGFAGAPMIVEIEQEAFPHFVCGQSLCPKCLRSEHE